MFSRNTNYIIIIISMFCRHFGAIFKLSKQFKCTFGGPSAWILSIYMHRIYLFFNGNSILLCMTHDSSANQNRLIWRRPELTSCDLKGWQRAGPYCALFAELRIFSVFILSLLSGNFWIHENSLAVTVCLQSFAAQERTTKCAVAKAYIIA